MRRVHVAGIVEEVARAEIASHVPSAASRARGPATLREQGAEHDALVVAEALQKFAWKRLPAARYLGISRITLWRKIGKYGLAAGKERADG